MYDGISVAWNGTISVARNAQNMISRPGNFFFANAYPAIAANNSTHATDTSEYSSELTVQRGMSELESTFRKFSSVKCAGFSAPGNVCPLGGANATRTIAANGTMVTIAVSASKVGNVRRAVVRRPAAGASTTRWASSA